MVAKAAWIVADENENSYVHVQPVTLTRVIVTFRCGSGTFSGSFRRVKVGEAADKA